MFSISEERDLLSEVEILSSSLRKSSLVRKHIVVSRIALPPDKIFTGINDKKRIVNKNVIQTIILYCETLRCFDAGDPCRVEEKLLAARHSSSPEKQLPVEGIGGGLPPA
jgi:hypothetical protein